MFRKLPIAMTGIAAMVAALGASPAMAATATQSMAVSSTLTNMCSVTTTAVAFTFTPGTNLTGNVTSANVDANGGFSVTCLNGGGWSIQPSNGNNYSSGYRMQIGATANRIPYTLTTTSATGTTISGATFSNTGTGSAQSTTIYGRIASGTTIPSVGAYTDSITFTITY